MANSQNLTGQLFTRLYVIARAEDHIQPNGQHKARWLCWCACGNSATVHAGSLWAGLTKSCGCLRLESKPEAKPRDHEYFATRGKERYKNPNYRRQIRGWAIQRRYGLSLAEYEAEIAEQKNLCALCGELMDEIGAKGRAPVLDHNHKTRKLRQFIHSDCNKALGLFGDDPAKIRKAAEYLERHHVE